MIMIRRWSVFLLAWQYAGSLVTAFTLGDSSRRRLFSLFLSSSNSNGPDELIGTLARLDERWEIQRKAEPTSRWSKYILKEQQNSADGFAEEFVYLLEPPGKTVPSSLIVFVGGAGLGQFPHIAYNEFLLRLSDKLNAAIIAAPYNVGLDHFGLAKTTGELTRKAILQCEDDPSKMYPETLPTYCIAHSLGCKLASIYMAATGAEYEGIGFVSFNNFGFSRTIGMAKTFADRIRESTGIGAGFRNDIVDQVFSFAENVVDSIGLEFTPTPSDTERLLMAKYDGNKQRKTRLFVFDDDDLDSSPDFVQSCEGPGPDVSALPGTHLSPVLFKFSLDELPEEVQDIAAEASGGVASLAFGNEKELHELVAEVSSWILGQGPTRKPSWQQEKPKLAGASDNE